MTSKQSKRERLKESRLTRAKALVSIDPRYDAPPPGAVLADASKLSHNNTYGTLPKFYIDKVVICRQCGTEEVWPAERQKWWYAEAKGNINTTAVLCLACRTIAKQKKAEAGRIHLEGLAKKHGE